MTELALAGSAALAGALVQSATGFGFALVLSPALFAVLDPHEAVTALLLLGMPLNLLVLFEQGRPAGVPWRSLAPMLAAALPGLALGAVVLALLSKPVLQVVVGACVIAAAALAGSVHPRVREPTLRSACGVGLTSGVLTTSTSVSGPPIVLWLEGHGLTPAVFRRALAASFLALNFTGALTLVIADGAGELVAPDVLAALLAFCVAGHLAGAWAFRRIDGERFRAIVLGLVAVTGAASVGAGLAGL